MKAEEMFKELGYKKVESLDLDTLAEYIYGDEEEGCYEDIAFCKDHMRINVEYPDYMLMDAIFKQIEEMREREDED